jgi:cysteinyl-tRNA synthetase
VFASGETLPLALLRDPWNELGATAGAAPERAARPPANEMGPTGASGLEAETDTARSLFDSAVASRDAAAAVRACLALESSLHEWSADPTQSDARDTARSSLRAMISALGDAADTGLVDPTDGARPWVEAMLEVRRIVRAEKRYDLSDIIRDAFAALGVEVRDTPAGVEWELQTRQ